MIGRGRPVPNSTANSEASWAELSAEQQAQQVLHLYKLGLDLVRYRSLWHRLLAVAGHSGAKRDQFAFASGEDLAVKLVNSSPELQRAWSNLIAQEPDRSRAKPLLPCVLRSTCHPLPPLPAEFDEQQQRARNESWALTNQLQNTLDRLEQLKRETNGV